MMRLPRGDEVPFTSGISGIVFLLAWYKVGTTQMIPAESVILGAWGAIYLIEIAARNLNGRPRAARAPARLPADPSRAPTDGGRT